MMKIALLISLGRMFILSACQTGAVPEPATPIPTSSQPPGSWEIGGGLEYSQEPVWEDTLVGLRLRLGRTEGDPKDGKLPGQSIVVYDLKTREEKRVIEPPAGYMINTPSIHGNKIVFAAVTRDEFFRIMISSQFKPPANYDIFMFDLETNQMRQLTTEEHAQTSPRIYGDTVVWMDDRNQSPSQYPAPFDVYALDLKTMNVRRVTANTTVEGYTQLAISSNLVVWTDMRHADVSITNHPENAPNYNNEIYVYDLATNQERRLTTSPANDRYPDIDSERVIWLRQVGYQKADVFMYDLESGQETQVSHSGYADSSPSISGDRIVWTDASASKGNTSNDVIINGQLPTSVIVMFDLKAQKETQLTSMEAGKVWLWPVIHVNHVVYIWSRQIGGVVYGLELPKQK